MILKKFFMTKASLFIIVTNIISAYAMEKDLPNEPQDLNKQDSNALQINLKVPCIYVDENNRAQQNAPISPRHGNVSPKKGISGLFKSSGGSRETLKKNKEEKEKNNEKNKSIDNIWERLSFDQKIKALSVLGYQDEEGLTPLMLAIKYKDNQLCSDLIIDERLDVNQADNEKRTPLMHAVISDNINAVKLLLSHGLIEVNAQDSYGNTALHYAALRARSEILWELILNPRIKSTITNPQGIFCYSLVNTNLLFEDNLRQVCFARHMIDNTLNNIKPTIAFEFPVQNDAECRLNIIVNAIKQGVSDFRFETAEPKPLPDCFTDDLIKKIAKVQIGTLPSSSSSNTDFIAYYKTS